MEGSRGGLGEEVRTGPSRRREFLSWVGGISGKPLLIAIIDADNQEKFQGLVDFFNKLLWISPLARKLPQLRAPSADNLRMRESVHAPGEGVTMTVAALSTAGFSQYIAASSNVSEAQQAWQSLQQSLAQGNLSAAASAFKTYNQLNPAPASSGSSPSQLTTDMTALGTAISSGNLSTAQSAFATVQSDLKTTPSQAITNAESAVAQTVQWVDDLLSLSDSSNSSSSTPVDPTSSILDSAYGLNTSSSTTDPTLALLESKYGDGSSASTSGASSSSTAADIADASSTASAPQAVSSGNYGSSASVNVYA